MATMRDMQGPAREASIRLLLRLRAETLDVYVKASANLSKEIRALETRKRLNNENEQYLELTIKGKKELEAALKHETDLLKEQINAIAERGVSRGVKDNAGRYTKDLSSKLKRYTTLSTAAVDGVFDRINSDLVLAALEKTYGGTTFSRRIWKATEAFKTDVRSVVAEGLARNRDVIMIAKDLETYVKTDAATLAKRYAKIQPLTKREGETDTAYRKRLSTLQHRVSHNVEYNSLRIVRTMTQGAIQDSNIAASDYVPSVQSFDWKLSPAHIVYSICEDIAAGNPWTYETFAWTTPPHPNCLSYVKYNEISEARFIDDLKRWSDNPTAGGTEYLNEWKAKYYDRYERGDSDNFFELFLSRSNDGNTLNTSGRAA